ncbi:MAG: PAS domain-containing sensor histidine kinase [Candidatus Thorarchaeota archaeon]
MKKRPHDNPPSSGKQDAISRSEDLLRGILEMANDGIAVIQEEEIVFANDAFAEMLKHEPEAVEGLFIDELIDPLERRYHPEKLRAFIGEKKGRDRFHTRLQRKDGELVSVDVSTNDFMFHDSPAIVAIIRDVTKSLSLKEAAEESETRFKGLYDSSPLAIFTLSPKGAIQDVNEAAEKLLGYQAKKMVGLNIKAFITEDEKSPGQQAIREILRGRTLRDVEIQMQHIDGHFVWVNIAANPLSPDTAKRSEIGFMALNIDRRKAAEVREYTAIDRAELYLDVISQDLNSVNQNTTFTLDLVNSLVKLPANVQSTVDETATNVRRAARMIANMRAIIAIKATPPMPEKTDLYPHFKRAVTEASRDVPSKTLKITSNIEDDAFEVLGHMYLWSAFFNIIHNALLYDPLEEVELEVNAKFADFGRAVNIEFIDNGPGIPDNMKETVFKRTGAQGKQAAGRGLGLTLVDQTIGGLDGRVWVEDRVIGDQSQGCRFIISLPAWSEKMLTPCGKSACITFYKSDHCIFCGPVHNTLIGVLDEMGLNHFIMEVINVDDPESGVSAEDLPALPTIRICKAELTGSVSEDELRSSVMNMLMMSCEEEPSGK